MMHIEYRVVVLQGVIAIVIPNGPSGFRTPGGTVLESGKETAVGLPAVSAPTLFGGEKVFRIDVPEGASQLKVQLTTSTPGVDVDLFVRRGEMPEVAGGKVVSDFASTRDGGDESITVNSYTTPALRPGTYFIAMALFTTDRIAECNLTATVVEGKAAAAPLLKGMAQRMQKKLAAVPKSSVLRVDQPGEGVPVTTKAAPGKSRFVQDHRTR
jgi:hypothetical protein